MGDPASLWQILWSSDPATTRAIGIVLGAALLVAVTIHIPLAVRLGRLLLLERRLRALVPEEVGGRSRFDGDAELLHDAMRASPLAETFQEFERRWHTAQIGEPSDRAPVRLADVFEDRPLLPPGPRRSLLPVLPGLFLGLGVLAALIGLIPGLGVGGAALSVGGAGLSVGGAAEAADPTWLATRLGLALRVTVWGFLCAIVASLAGRLLEGGFAARSAGLDALVERAFGSVSPGELAELTRQTQQRSLDTLGKELTRFANELNERLDRGLQRIEQSTARSANLVSQEQRGALHTVVQELSLSVRQGVEHHLGELRGALQRAVEHQSSVTGGLAETFERMVENAQTQDRVARTLGESAHSVEEAARAMRSSTGELQPILEHLKSTSRSLAETSDQTSETQKTVARTAEGLRSALEHAASGVDDQRQFLEMSLSEIRRAIGGLGDGLGESLQRSLRTVDDVLGSTVGQLRETLAESNETIERLAGPIRAAEGTTRETHVALDRVRAEVEALGQWMSQTAKPLRSSLVDVDARVDEIARAIAEFTSNARQMDKSMEALREEIHEESRRLQGTGSELGRRLHAATDAIVQLERSTGEARRRSRTTSPSGSSPMASPPPPEAEPAPIASPTPEPRRARHSEPAAPPIAASVRSSEPPPTIPNDDEVTESMEPPRPPADERESTLPGYRLGASRAQGPDPYERFDSTGTSPSNVHHLPTRDRELGDDLKLSGLLGPSRVPGKPGSAGSEDDDLDEDTRPVRTPRSRDESD